MGTGLAQLLDTTELEVLLTDQADVDITNMDQVRKYVEMNRPDVIINCAGIGGVEYYQKNGDLAYKVNAIGARNLSVAARSVHGKMVQLSTDDIFDGKADRILQRICCSCANQRLWKVQACRRGICKDHCAQIFNYPQLLGIWKGRKLCYQTVG